MTGVTFPVAMSLLIMVRSSWLLLAINMYIFWLTNRDHTIPLIQRAGRPIFDAPSTPAPMYIPLGFNARLQADNEWFATRSKIRS
jgi:hypothetical protein